MSGTLSLVLASVARIFEPASFFFMLFGTLEGVIIGALPGLSGSIGIILLLPLVYRLESDIALVMLCGVFCGSMFGGSVSAILLNTPGTPSAAATLLDGYPLAKRGQGGKAIGTGAIASFIGGIISSLCLMLVAPQLSKVALQFQAADYFSLALFGLTMVAASTGKNVLKGLISAAFGLFIATVGVDPIQGASRFTFGNHYLMNGFPLLPVLIGIFAISEVLAQAAERSTGNVQFQEKSVKNLLPSFKEIKSFFWTTIVGSVIGVLVGIVPGTGGSISTFMAYDVCKKFSKHPEEYGNGALEGIAACESSNNGTTGGALIPMLSLGIPGDVVTSVMLSALVLIGITPGPQIFTENADMIYVIFVGMFVIQFLMLGLGLIFARWAPYVLRIPTKILMPIILVLCIVGAYSQSNQVYHVLVAFIFGVVGLFMKKYGYPGAPLILGIVLGPLAENNLNRALQISKNDWSILLRRPISLTFIILSILFVTVQVRALYLERKKEKQAAGSEAN